jgi:hypothetical protein
MIIGAARNSHNSRAEQRKAENETETIMPTISP